MKALDIDPVLCLALSTCSFPVMISPRSRSPSDSHSGIGFQQQPYSAEVLRPVNHLCPLHSACCCQIVTELCAGNLHSKSSKLTGAQVM